LVTSESLPAAPDVDLRDMTEKQDATQREDAKARMREALERKKQGTGAGPHVEAAGHGKAEHAHGKAGSRREFRRKSS